MNGREKPFLAHVEKCRAIALMLWQDCHERLHAEKGEAAWEAHRAWKRLRPFMHFFASEGVLHMDCPRPVCKRAKRCACDSMRCVRHEVLTSAEEAKARADYGEFIARMTAPETEASPSFRGAGKACEPGIQKRPNVHLDSGSARTRVQE